MKTFLLHLFIALVMFFIGNTAAHVFQSSVDKIPSDAADEDEIKSLVFSYQIQFYFDSEAHTFYLADYNYQDPSERVMRNLLNSNLHAEKLSNYEYCNRRSSKIVLLRLGRINRVGETEAVVGTSYHDLISNTTQSFVYYLVKEDGVWKFRWSESVG